MFSLESEIGTIPLYFMKYICMDTSFKLCSLKSNVVLTFVEVFEPEFLNLMSYIYKFVTPFIIIIVYNFR